MAFKPIKLDAQTTCVSWRDPAIDRESEAGEKAVDAYISKMWQDPASWRETLVMKSGEHPTVFSIGVIPSSVAASISDQIRRSADIRGIIDNAECQWLAFLSCIRDIHGIDAPKVKIDGVEYVDPAFLRKNFVKTMRNVACEIGLAGWLWNQINDDEIKNLSTP